MSTPFKPIQIPPGVVANPTKQMASSNWSAVNLMRWVEGQMSPVGGQAQFNYTFASRCRAIHGWYGLDGIYRVAYLCEKNLYVDVGGLLGDTIVDITPSEGITPPESPTEGGYGTGTFSDQTYGTPRDFSSEPAPEYQQQSLDVLPDIWSLDNFGGQLLAMASPDGNLLMWDPNNGNPGVVFTDPAYTAFTTTQATLQMTNPNPGTVGPGMNVYNITSGRQVGTVSSWPTNSGTVTLTANALSVGNIGDVLQFGNIAVPVVAISGRGVVPVGRCFVVTNERFVMIFGAYDAVNGGSFRRFAWCDQENFQAWDYTNVTSQAGYLDIEPASPIVCAVAGPLGILMWTGKSTYFNAFLGIPYVYNYTEIAKACTPWSPMSVAATSSMTLWMSQQGMFSYNGAYVVPLGCAVRTWIDDDVDLLNVRSQACAVHVSPFNEFWWFFPQNGQPYNTRCVYYNYKEGWWGQGQMSRSAGVTASYTVQTTMADGVNAYLHEIGNAYPTNVPLPWAETYDLNLAAGSRLTTLKQMIPDVKGDVGNLLYSLKFRTTRVVNPNATPPAGSMQQTTPQPVRPDGYLDFRVTARDIWMRIQLAGPQVLPVTVGQHLVDSVPRGDR
jgi:hypothetical protein